MQENRLAYEGGLVELGRLWANTIYTWRYNDRVVHKPSGSLYHRVYRCIDATATNTDAPNATPGKWQDKTVWVDEPYWDPTKEYNIGDKVLYLGAIFTATGTSTNVEPGTSLAHWDYGLDSNIGIISYPMKREDLSAPAWDSGTAYSKGSRVLYDGYVYQALAASTNEKPDPRHWGPYWTWVDDNFCYAPYIEYYVGDVRYDITPDVDTNKLYITQRGIVRFRDGGVWHFTVDDLFEWAPTIKHVAG